MTVPAGAGTIEQTSDGTRDSAHLVESFDGLGEGFEASGLCWPAYLPARSATRIDPAAAPRAE